MLMTSCFVCATLNLGRKKSTGTEPNDQRNKKKSCAGDNKKEKTIYEIKKVVRTR